MFPWAKPLSGRDDVGVGLLLFFLSGVLGVVHLPVWWLMGRAEVFVVWRSFSCA